jgi:thiazole/oxazole-forming peptide maturase SagC family component
MSKHLKYHIKPYFSIIIHSANAVELRSGVWHQTSFSLTDETESGKLAQFIQLLDGSKTFSEVLYITSMNRSTGEGIIDHLRELDVIEIKPVSAFDYYTALFTPAFESSKQNIVEGFYKKVLILSHSHLGQEIKKSLIQHTQLSNIDLAPENLSQILSATEDEWLYNGLKFENVVQQFSDLKDSFVICAFDHVNPVFSNRFNRIAIALGIPWIHAALDGPFIFIGPTFIHPHTACYDCFETRVSMNLREYQTYQKYKNAIANHHIVRHSTFPLQNMLLNLMISHLTLEIVNYLITNNNFTKNKVLSIYLPTMEITFNEFLKVSNCPTCGTAKNRDDHQFYFDVQKLLQVAV